MFCPNCGNQIPDGSKFCGKCGAQLSGAAPAPQGAPAYQAAPTPQGAPAYQGGVPPYQPAPGAVPGQPAKRGGKGLIIGLAVVAVAVIAAIIFGITQCVGGGGRGSAQDVANGVSSAFQTLVDGKFSSDSVSSFANQLIDLMPAEAVDVMLEEAGVTREEISLGLGGFVGDLDSYAEYMEEYGIEVSFSFGVGSKVDSDDVEYLNELFADEGIDITVTEAYRISMDMSMTVDGSSQDPSVDESGFVAIKVGNSWYLWGDIWR